METKPEFNAGGFEGAADAGQEKIAESGAVAGSAADPATEPVSSAPPDTTGADVARIKADLEKLHATLEGLTRKTSTIADATARVSSEMRSRGESFEKTAALVSAQSRRTFLMMLIVGLTGLGLCTILGLLLGIELRRAGAMVGALEPAMKDVRSMASKLDPLFNAVEELSKNQESVQGALAKIDKGLEASALRPGPEKQLAALEKLIAAQGERMVRLEREIVQQRAATKKADPALLRGEIESAFRRQRELAEATAKKTAPPVQEARPPDVRPQYPRPENR